MAYAFCINIFINKTNFWTGKHRIADGIDKNILMFTIILPF